MKTGATSRNMKDPPPIDVLLSPTGCEPVIASPTMLAIQKAAIKLAELRTPVLIVGEPGSGRQTLARSIHAASRYNGASFRVLDCSEFAPNKEGSKADTFVGAAGTLYFSDIAELSLPAQREILKLIQTESGPRILFSTCDNLEHGVRNRTLSEEFYNAVSSVCLRVPPLRARRDDIGCLAEHFLEQYSREFQCAKPKLSPQARDFLLSYHWPGNVAELQMAMKSLVAIVDERLVIAALRSSSWIGTRKDSEQFAPLKQTARAASFEAERKLISDVLASTGWNRKRAAEKLQISYKALLYKLKRIGIESPASAGKNGE